MTHLVVRKINDVHLKVDADASTIQELRDHFTFDVPSAKFHPMFKCGVWDGMIRLMTPAGVLYTGLMPQIVKFAKDREYHITIDEQLKPRVEITMEAVNDFIDCLDLPEKFTPREYQRVALYQAIRHKRRILISPTASGKSLIIYMLVMWRRYIDKEFGRLLVVVPTISLVRQMKGDFVEYGHSPDEIKIIMGGEDKNLKDHESVIVSTWQSIANIKDKKWLQQFATVVGDEAHTFKSKSLVTIMEQFIHCEYRIGTTGTLDDKKVNKMVLEGLFGECFQVERTENLMKSGHIAKLNIKCIVLDYPDEDRQLVSKMRYADEIDWIVTNERRLKFVCDLALHQKGNTLVMFQFVEKHGKPLYDLITKMAEPERKIFFVAGEVSGEVREEIRGIVEKETDAIIVCSFGTMSTGVNIKNLHNAIAASPTKSMIRLLQSIGRILRLGSDKDEATWYDICDDLSWKSKLNYTLKHFRERVRIYSSEKLSYKVFNRKF